MRAMILAAGYGTRLWPLTIDRAKPAIPFMGRPLVGYVAEYLAGYGFGDVIVNLHHRPESVRASLGDGGRFGVRLHYVEEPVILGTGGALDNARSLLGGETFVVINGKLATDIDLSAALKTHRETGALATLVLRPNPARERYSTVEVSEGLVRGFGGYPASDNASGEGNPSRPDNSDSDERGGSVQLEDERESLIELEDKRAGLIELEDKRSGSVKLEEERGGSLQLEGERGGSALSKDTPLMFTGIHIIEPRIFDFIPRGVFSHTITDVYLPAIERGERLAAHVSDGNWYELSTVSRYLDTSIALMLREGRSVEVGDGSVIEAGADVSDSVLWENVSIRAGARLRRSVIGAGVEVTSDDIFEDVAVVRADLVEGVERPPKGLSGEVRGPNFVAPLPR